jgi:hypothetical protein
MAHLLALTAQPGSPTAQAIAATAQVRRRKWKLLMSRFRYRTTCSPLLYYEYRPVSEFLSFEDTEYKDQSQVLKLRSHYYPGPGEERIKKVKIPVTLSV